MKKIRRKWLDYTSLVLVIAGFLYLYHSVLASLVADWDTNESYSHGYFIPFISAYMVWSKRAELAKAPAMPSNWGLLILIVGLLQLLMGHIGSEFFVQRTSMILVIAGVIIFCYGFEIFKILLVPVIYLIFMIPLPAIIWNKLAFPLQLFSSYITEHVVSFLGISILRQGNVLHLPATTLEVVDACSGLRSLVTMFALSSFVAWQSDLKNTGKWLLFFSAAPIAIIANTIRLSATAVLASHYCPDVAHGFLHEFSGFVTFAIGITMLMLTDFVLKKHWSSRCPPYYG